MLSTGGILGIVGGVLVTVGISYGILKEEHTTSIRNNGNRGLWNSNDPVKNLKQGLKNQNNAARAAKRKQNNAARAAASAVREAKTAAYRELHLENIKRFTNYIINNPSNINVSNKSKEFVEAVINELVNRGTNNPSQMNKLMEIQRALLMAGVGEKAKNDRQKYTTFGNFTEGQNPGQTIVINGKRYSNVRVATDEHINAWIRNHPQNSKNNIERYILTTKKFTAIERAINAVQKVTKNRTIINNAKIAALQETTRNSTSNLNLNTRVKNAALKVVEGAAVNQFVKERTR